MSQGIYKDLLEVMKKRGGGYAGMDIPEFYAMAEVLFTPEEAEVNNAMPRGPLEKVSASAARMTPTANSGQMRQVTRSYGAVA